VRLVLVRHGETEHNAGGITLGRADVPLNERGRSQAQALASLADGSHVLADASPISAIYASPLDRAIATARPLAEALDIKLREESRLIEMDIGELEDMPFEELRVGHADFLRRWLSDEVPDARMPGGETLAEVQERAWNAVQDALAQHTDETIVMVTHNFVLLSLLCRMINLPLAKFRGLRHDLAAVSLIDFSGSSVRAVTLNDRCHLDGL
jgi:broad specificity phosphatase PhoE